jgi:hypothetical protein
VRYGLQLIDDRLKISLTLRRERSSHVYVQSGRGEHRLGKVFVDINRHLSLSLGTSALKFVTHRSQPIADLGSDRTPILANGK